MFNGRFYGWHTRLYSGVKSFLDLTHVKQPQLLTRMSVIVCNWHIPLTFNFDVRNSLLI